MEPPNAGDSILFLVSNSVLFVGLNMSGVLKFRPAEPEDEPFFKELRGQLDAERLCLDYVNFNDEKLRNQLLEMQYNAHQAHYDKAKLSKETKDNVIELDDVPIGRFIVTGNRDEIQLSDITIEKKFRGIGIGQAVLQMTKSECAESGRALRLHVDKTNPAYQFYLQQELYVIEELDTCYYMEWHPKGPTRGKLYFHSQA